MAKNKGKRQGGALRQLGNWVFGTKPPTEQQGLIATTTYFGGSNQISEWPAEFDNTVLEHGGDVAGKHCKTVGEYKAATAKFYRDMP